MRYYDPNTGRFLTRDPIGYEGGINLYTYCDGNPVNRVDPSGTQNWFTDQLTAAGKTLRSWGNAFDFLGGYVVGVGPNRNHYKAGDIQLQDMMQSVSANDIRQQLRSVGYRQGPIPNPKSPQGKWNGFSTFQGWLNIFREPTNGTQAQLGAFEWRAEVHGNRVHIFLSNKADFNSLVLHIPEEQNKNTAWGYLPLPEQWDRASSGFGPLGNVYQNFDWWETVPAKYIKK